VSGPKLELLAAPLLALTLALAPAALAQEQPVAEPQASLPDVEDEVMCPICGTALNLSESPQAERERVFIRKLINEGRTKDEIKDALVEEYGPEVLAVPDASGFDLVAWVLPGLVILIGAGALTVGIRRWRGETVDDAEGGPPTATGGAGANERLDADLERFGR
jgi:cytochrome c-type biogenesis protein CcmH